MVISDSIAVGSCATAALLCRKYAHLPCPSALTQITKAKKKICSMQGRLARRKRCIKPLMQPLAFSAARARCVGGGF
jgi:hypothetical protein